MEQRELKFRSAHYNHDGTFNGFSYWGLLDTVDVETASCFTSPTMRSGTLRKVEEQYIGAKDKKGKEIYDGDILWHSASGSNVKIKYETATCAYLCVGLNDSWEQFLYEFPFNDLEIVGNIHESPELLKGGEQDGR